MKTPVLNTDSDISSDPRIDAFLSPDEDASIVDSLFSVLEGQSATDAKDVLERVMFARLQARIAHRMRQSIQGPREANAGGNDRNSSRSAA